MHIDLDDAIQIYAKASRRRYGRGARKRFLATARALRARGDHEGAMVWERVAREVDRVDQQPTRPSAAYETHVIGKVRRSG